MANITHLGRVLVPVSDQDEAIAWYSDKLGFSLSADIAFGEDDRWVEVAPPAGGATVALVPARDEYPAGRMTGIAFDSSDPRADHAEFQANGLDVDAEIMGGDGVVPLLFFLRDLDGNHLMVVEAQPQ
jgi:catechol 2,3-dioxygenase-like lactoylglutathione lyase family enzyme